jgi:hypothetical protein
VLAIAGRSQGPTNYDVLTAAYQTGSPPPPTTTAQFLLPTKIVRKVNKNNAAKSVLTIAATLDTGPDPASFDATASLSIGDVVVPMTAFAPDKRGVWRYRDAQVVFSIVPSAYGSSRCAVAATLKGAQVATLDANAAVGLTLSCGDVIAKGGCTLKNGAFALGRGGLPSDSSVPRSAKATLVGPGKDSFSVQWVIAPSEPFTYVADVAFEFGPKYSKTIPGASFKRHGTVWTFVDKTHALPSMTINSATGFVVVTGTKADLGEFVDGPQAVRVVAGPAGDAAVVDVRMVKKNRSLKY